MTIAGQICATGRRRGGGGGGDSMKSLQAQKECEKQRACEMELLHLLAVAERNVHTLGPESVSTIINALSKLPPRYVCR